MNTLLLRNNLKRNVVIIARYGGPVNRWRYVNHLLNYSITPTKTEITKKISTGSNRKKCLSLSQTSTQSMVINPFRHHYTLVILMT